MASTQVTGNQMPWDTAKAQQQQAAPQSAPPWVQAQQNKMPWEQAAADTQEKGFLSSVSNAVSQQYSGNPKLAAMVMDLRDTKPNSAEYYTQLAKIKAEVGAQEQASKGNSTLGNIVGSALGLPAQLGDFISGGPVLGAAEEAKALAHGQTQQKAQEIGDVANISSALGFGINPGKSMLGGIGRGAAANTIAGQTNAVAQTGDLDAQQAAIDAITGGVFGGGLHYLAGNKEQPQTSHTPESSPAAEYVQSMAAKQAQDALVQRANENWTQPELFGSYTSAEHIGYQRQLEAAQQSGQGVLNFETPSEIQPIYGVPGETNQTKVGSNLPATGEIPAIEAAKVGERNVQGPYQQTYGMEPLQDDLFKGTPVGAALEDKLNQQNKQPTGKPVESSPLDIIGAKETQAVPLENIPDLVQAEKAKNGGAIPDITNRLAENAMDVQSFLKYADNPFLTKVFDTMQSLKANAREAFRSAAYDEQLKGVGRPKMGLEGGASPFLKLPENLQNGIMEALAPFWNKEGEIPWNQLGLNDKQVAAGQRLMDFLRKDLDETNAKRIAVGKDPIQAQANYMPRMREGNFYTVGTKNGLLSHFEGFQTKGQALKAAKELQAQGHEASVHFKGETPVSESVNQVGKDTYARHQGMIAEARAMDSNNVPGYLGDRNPADMRKAIVKYLSQSENNHIGLKLQQLDNMLNKELPPHMYTKIREYMDEASGLGSRLDNKALKAVQDGISKVTGGRVDLTQITSGMNKYFGLIKVGMSPIHLANVMATHPYMMLAHMSHMASQGMDMGKLMGHAARAGLDLMSGQLSAKEKGVLNWAQRAGALENSLALRSVQNKLSAPSSKMKNFMQDPFMSSKLDSLSRETHFLALYNHATKDLGMTDQQAKQIAMKGTKDALISMAKEDRAPISRRLSFLTPLTSGLSTFDTGMVGRSTAYLKMAMQAGASKKAMLPFAILTMGGLLSGGVRGSAAVQYADEAVKLWNKFFPEYQKMSPNDLLFEMEKRNPNLGAVINGIPSQATGLDMTHQLGMPGWIDSVPGISSMFSGKAPPAVNAVANAGNALFRLGEDAAGYRTLSEADKQRYQADILPRFLQELPKTTNVLNSKDQSLGQLTPQQLMAAQATGIPSLEEKRIRSQDEAVRVNIAQGSALKNKVTNDVVNSMIYGDDKAVNTAMNRYTEALPELKARGVSIEPNELLSNVISRIKDKQTTPEQRAMLQKNLQGIIAHFSYGKE